ncbi:hypothetical protein IVB38_14315 [Bradyrhizobium sp. 38]|uniref:hypothetical protein n=1 Tax=unclassified Bradyrhizobium TaxID=2631580 RepID=UPI001FFAF35C|nr:MULTISPECIES: hypothetical protein [unclassified Bradyrhizobium]MCK1337170.1 hypothetical protein [Bradyrhizobium sp. 38]MCK1778264.1 hypothetical protein [Bradyrhizobium sp. 132]
MKVQTSKPIANPDEFVWGAVDIGKYLGRSKEATWFMLEQDRVPGAKKIAGRWGMHVPTFLASFQASSAPRASAAA